MHDEAQPTPPAAAPRQLLAAFVDRPVLTLMVAVAILLVGAVSFTKLPLRFLPEGLSENEINMWIPVPTGRTPAEIEDKVVEPFEELLRTIPGLRTVESESTATWAQFTITLSEGMDTALAAAEVRDRAQRAKLLWPAEVDRYFSWREDASTVPLAFFQMLTPGRNPDWDFLIDKVVRPRLEAVDGVGRVDVWGLLDETIRIWFDRDKLIAHRVDYGSLLRRIGSDNFAEPVGELDDGQHRVLLRIDSKLKSLADIEAYPVRPGLVLGDIARVERVPSVRDSLSRYNQKYTYSGMVSAAAGTNPVEASERLRAAVAGMRDDPRLADLEFRLLFDQGAMITDSLQTLLSTSLQGGLLALVVLWLFLRNVRFTLVIALAIPMALLVVGGWLFFAGDSLNLLSMCGMTLAVGMLVDNSVVVMESIRGLRERGLPLRTACIRGAQEVGLAVSVATLTTVVVILPMVFMGDGQARIMLGAVGVPLSVALIASLGVALLLLPSGVRHLGGQALPAAPAVPATPAVPAVPATPAVPSSAPGDSAAAAPAAQPEPADAAPAAWRDASRWSLVGWLLRSNQALLRVALRHRLLAAAATALVLATCQVPWQALELGSGGGGIFSRGDVSIHLELPRGLDLADVEREVVSYEDFVLQHREEWRVASVSSRFGRRSATIDIELEEDVPQSEVATYRSRVEQAWPPRPGVKVALSDATEAGGGGSSRAAGGDDDRGFALRIYGRDSEHLMRLAQQARAQLARLPQVDKVEIPQLDDNEEVIVRLDRDRMQDLAVPPQTLFGSLVAGLQGHVLTEFEERGRETRLIAEFERAHDPSLRDLRQTQVRSERGAFQQLDSMAHIGLQKAMESIARIDGRTHITLVGRRAAGVGPAELSRAVAELMRGFPMPRGYEWSEESSFLEAREQMAELMDALYLGIILVFLLMGILFESIILPLSILFIIPFAVLGAVWSLHLLVGELDPMAVIGLILLSGIVVNNGIVLLDCIARLRRQLPRQEAILEGTRRRLRAIVMTAATTVVGLLPMALFGEPTGSGLNYVGMSAAVAGGLATCTVFTAFIVPLCYTFLDDLSEWLRAVWQRARPTAAPALAAPAPTVAVPPRPQQPS